LGWENSAWKIISRSILLQSWRTRFGRQHGQMHPPNINPDTSTQACSTSSGPDIFLAGLLHDVLGEPAGRGDVNLGFNHIEIVVHCQFLLKLPASGRHLLCRAGQVFEPPFGGLARCRLVCDPHTVDDLSFVFTQPIAQTFRVDSQSTFASRCGDKRVAELSVSEHALLQHFVCSDDYLRDGLGIADPDGIFPAQHDCLLLLTIGIVLSRELDGVGGVGAAEPD
jgi:hypothetical protein